MFLGYILLYSLIVLAVPVVIIILIIRAVRGSKHNKKLTYKDLLLWSFLVPAAIAGLAAVFSTPYAWLDVDYVMIDDQNTASLFIYLVASMVLLMSGIFVKKITGKFLMSLAILVLVIGVVPYIGSLGSIGAFLAVLAVFAILVTFIIRQSKKGHHG